ncbi:hypothetical protein HPB52_002866 [Rhipicephalus sanguineus]|uniref:Uncharacterized protein n=1 Tax=Rhipicephalus sanguineus TaxID=34632 RepID=A0A9D4QGN2_RHISA|nr:hypothetical protein HPB52_002866 [Rhipicephalus sanguineus]
MEIQDVRSLTENGILADASALLTEATSGEAAVAALPVVNLSIPFLSSTQGIMIGTTQDGSGAFVVDAAHLSLLSSSGVFADGVLQLSVQVNVTQFVTVPLDRKFIFYDDCIVLDDCW